MSLSPLVLRRLIAVLLVAAWLPQVVGFWPGPSAVSRESVRQQFREAIELSKQFPDSDKTRADRAQFQALVDDPDLLIRDLWLSWGKYVALVLAGLCAALMTWRKIRTWQWLVLGTSLAYFWLFSWPVALKPIWEYASSLGEAMTLLRTYFKSPAFVHNNFVVPIFLFLALVLSAVLAVRSRRQEATSNSTVEGDARESGARPSP